MFLIIKFPNLIIVLIPFSFNQAIIFLYKYSCLCFNNSVFNWTFCQLLYSRKNPIARELEFKEMNKFLWQNAPVSGSASFLPSFVRSAATGCSSRSSAAPLGQTPSLCPPRPVVKVIKLFFLCKWHSWQISVLEKTTLKQLACYFWQTIFENKNKTCKSKTNSQIKRKQVTTVLI